MESSNTLASIVVFIVDRLGVTLHLTLARCIKCAGWDGCDILKGCSAAPSVSHENTSSCRLKDRR
jgi:hypothetical protein